MADPKGYLVVPVGYRSDGTLHAVELDDSDRLKVLIDAITGSVTVEQTTPANLTIANHGWFGAAWKKSPLPFGYSGQIFEQVGSATLAAGTNAFSTTTVPAGEIQVITHLSMKYIGTTPTRIACHFFAAGSNQEIYNILAPVTQQVYDKPAQIVLMPADKFTFQVVGATLNDDFWGNVWGYRLDTDQ